MANYLYKISKNGEITGLWSDPLSSLEGNVDVQRASRVEYNPEIQKWTIFFLKGPYANAFLIKTFVKRSEALKVERNLFNFWLKKELIL